MFFEKQVDLTDRKAMIRFLKEHVRYFTMNSWNRSTSYANNVKFYKLGLTEEQETSAYQSWTRIWIQVNFNRRFRNRFLTFRKQPVTRSGSTGAVRAIWFYMTRNTIWKRNDGNVSRKKY